MPVYPAFAAQGPASVFRQLIDSHPMPMLVAGLDNGVFKLVNRAAGRLLGLDDDERQILDHGHFWSDPAKGALALRRLATDERSLPAVFRLDGHPERRVELSGSEILLEGEVAILILLRETAAQDSHRGQDREAFLEAVLENLPIGIFVKDMQDDGRYVLFNEASGRIAGKAPGEIIGTLDRSNGFKSLAEQFRREDTRVIGERGSMTVSEAVIQPDGSQRIVRTIKSALAQGNEMPARFVLGVSYDITEARKIEERLAYLAHHDALTGLANHDLFVREFRHLVLGSAERPVALFCLDIDNFKSINDRLGHHAGDTVLQETGRRLSDFVASGGVAARLGGDEFAVAVAHPGAASTRELAARLYASLARPIVTDGIEEPITVSIGCVLVERPEELNYLRKNADLALYTAKKEGRARVQVYHPAMRADFDRRESTAIDLRRAIAAHEFIWHYQPIIALADGRISAFEALVRWNHPVRGLLQPGAFIDVAEQNGQVCPIGEMMFEATFRAAAGWPDDIRLALNLSVRQLQDEALLDRFAACLAAAGLPADRVEIEVTETIFLSEHASALETLGRMKDLGVRTVIDDFGVGYSSLSYLRTFPFDKIKLDRSFVSGANPSSGDDAIVAAVAGIASGFGLVSTAEGVESPEQLARLRAAGFDEAQGFLFSRPIPEEEVASLLRTISVEAATG